MRWTRKFAKVLEVLVSVKSWRGGCKLQFRLKTRSLDFRLNSSFFAAKGCEDVLAWLHHTEVDERGRDPIFSGAPKWHSKNLQPRKPSQPIKTCWYILVQLERLKTGYVDPELILNTIYDVHQYIQNIWFLPVVIGSHWFWFVHQFLWVVWGS